jgi:hypothetical protein
MKIPVAHSDKITALIGTLREDRWQEFSEEIPQLPVCLFLMQA